MAETFRKRKVEDFVQRLRVRESILRQQLLCKEFEKSEQFLAGQLSAVDAIIRELAEEFDLNFRRFRGRSTDCDELGEKEWLEGAAKNPAFAFLADPEEDLYTLNDGKPIDVTK